MVEDRERWPIVDETQALGYVQTTVARGSYAARARFDKSTKRIVVDLANVTTQPAPTRLIQGLQKAAGKDLIEILGANRGLYCAGPKSCKSTDLGCDFGLYGRRPLVATCVASRARPCRLLEEASNLVN